MAAILVPTGGWDKHGMKKFPKAERYYAGTVLLRYLVAGSDVLPWCASIGVAQVTWDHVRIILEPVVDLPPAEFVQGHGSPGTVWDESGSIKVTWTKSQGHAVSMMQAASYIWALHNGYEHPYQWTAARSAVLCEFGDVMFGSLGTELRTIWESLGITAPNLGWSAELAACSV